MLGDTCGLPVVQHPDRDVAVPEIEPAHMAVAPDLRGMGQSSSFPHRQHGNNSFLCGFFLSPVRIWGFAANELAQQAVLHSVDVALHFLCSNAYLFIFAVQSAQPAVIEPVNGMGMHVEKIPIWIGLQHAAYGVLEPGAVEFDQLADCFCVDDAVQKGHQTNVVGSDLFGKIDLSGGLRRDNETGILYNYSYL